MRINRTAASMLCTAAVVALAAGCGTTVPQVSTIATGAGGAVTGRSGDTTAAADAGLGGPVTSTGATATTSTSTGTAVSGAGQAPGSQESTTTPRSGTTVAGGSLTPGVQPSTSTGNAATGRTTATTATTAATKTTTTSKASAKATAGTTRTVATTGPAAAGPITIGYTTDHDLSSATSALGISGANPGDVDGELKAVALQLNKSGGVNGHQITLYDYDFKATDYENSPTAADQAACTAFAQDEHVSVVLDTQGFGNYGMDTCLGQSGIPVVTENYGTAGDDDSNYTGNLFSASLMSTDKYVPLLVSHLKTAGFFTGWNTASGAASSGVTATPVKVGILHFDTPELDHYADLVVKQLASIGITVDPSDDVSYPSNIGSEASVSESAVLKFASDGVTHVFNANILFYEAAASQGYKPRYEVDDLIATPQALTANVSSAQLHGAMGAGYWPEDEVNSPPDPTPSTGACKAIMNAAGETAKDQFGLRFQLEACDDLNLTARLAQLGGGTSTAAFQKGAAAIGNSFVPAMTYSASLTASGHAGAQTVKTFVYTDGCSCFTFNGQ